MHIVIPTLGRVGRQQTLRWIPKTWMKHTTVVCPEEEIGRHEGVVSHDVKNGDVAGMPNFLAQPGRMTIAQKRAWIMDQKWDSSGKILMLDDDLQFYVRRDDVPDRLRYAKYTDTVDYLDQLENILSPEVPHAGFGVRQGNQNNPAGWHGPGRMMLALGYHLPTVLKVCELGRIEHREDFDYALQLLRAGYPNKICHTFVVGQGGYNSKGGCSEPGNRTLEKSNEDAEKLARLHPGYVTTVQKSYKNSPRIEVICRWKKALEHGTQRRAAADGGAEAGTAERRSRGSKGTRARG